MKRETWDERSQLLAADLIFSSRTRAGRESVMAVAEISITTRDESNDLYEADIINLGPEQPTRGHRGLPHLGPERHRPGTDQGRHPRSHRRRDCHPHCHHVQAGPGPISPSRSCGSNHLLNTVPVNLAPGSRRRAQDSSAQGGAWTARAAGPGPPPPDHASVRSPPDGGLTGVCINIMDLDITWLSGINSVLNR